MPFFESYRERNGNYLTIQWTLGEWIFSKFLGFIVMLIASCLFSIVLPTLWLLIYFISIESQRFWIKITAIVACIYYLLDYHFGWICWKFLTPIIGERGLTLIAIYNSGLLLTLLILLFFDRKIYQTIEPNNPRVTDGARTTAFFVYTVVMVIGCIFVAKMLLPMFISQFTQPVV